MINVPLKSVIALVPFEPYWLEFTANGGVYLVIATEDAKGFRSTNGILHTIKGILETHPDAWIRSIKAPKRLR